MNVEKTYMPVVAIPLATLQIVHLFANTEEFVEERTMKLEWV